MIKQKAFTLLEIIISLLISSIVIMVVYYFIGMTQKVIQQRKVNLTSHEDLGIFDGVVRNDIFRSKDLILGGNQLKVIGENLNEIYFTFYPDSIIKQQSNIRHVFKLNLGAYHIKEVILNQNTTIKTLELIYLLPNDTLISTYYPSEIEK